MTPALSAHEPGKRKSTVDFQVAGMKRDLAQWLDQKCGAKDSTAIRMALLEVALDRYLAERTADLADLPPAAADATDMMQVVLRRAVQRRREELQDSKRPLEGTAGPADDEECANRLINTLTLLDRLAGHVPDHLVSRQEPPVRFSHCWSAGLPAASAGRRPARTCRPPGGTHGESDQDFVNGRCGPANRAAGSRRCKGRRS